MNLRRCNRCGMLVKVINGNSNIKCCGEDMQQVVANTFDAAVEKHVPEYVVDGNMINVKVNHVMEDNHYIEWISYVYDGKEEIVYFRPGEEVCATFKYVKGATIYSYCNLHSLWSKVVE